MSQRKREMYYVDGSTAKKMSAQPDYVYEKQRQQTVQPKKQQKVSASADRALAFNLKYTLFVVTSVFIMVAACVTMLVMEGKVNEQQNRINMLQAELETIQDDNAAYKVSLDNMYSLEDIYNVAINELGMVYARKGQIVYYESANEDYVKQYQDVPEAN